MALAIDASTPAATGIGSGVSSATSASFSPPANSVIVVFVSNVGKSTSASGVSAITDSLGSHLTYTEIAGVNSAGNPYGEYQDAEAWSASVGASAPGSMTITVTFANATESGVGVAGILLPVVFTGAASSQNGASSSVINSSSAPSVSLTPGATGSLVFGIGSGRDPSTTVTPGTGQTDSINGSTAVVTEATIGHDFWVQYATATTTAGSAVTINDTAPTGNDTLLAVEILAGSGGPPPQTPNPRVVSWPQAMFRSSYR